MLLLQKLVTLSFRQEKLLQQIIVLSFAWKEILEICKVQNLNHWIQIKFEGTVFQFPTIVSSQGNA